MQASIGMHNGYAPSADGRPTLLPAKFYWKEKKVEENPPQFTKVPYILIYHPGGDTTNRPASEVDKQRYPRQWAAFSADQDQSEVGWTLDNCAFLDVAQIATYKARNIKTIEALSAAPDTAIHGIMGAREHRKQAAALLKQASDGKPLAELVQKNSALENEIDLLKKQLAEVLEEFGKAKEKKAK